MLNGTARLFKGEINDIQVEKVFLEMGNNNNANFDITITTTKNKLIYGEAFNVAKSFFKVKYRQTINKLYKNLENNQLKCDNTNADIFVILINKDVEDIYNGYHNKREKDILEKFKIRVIPVFSDYKVSQ